ncbi:MAG TPA: tetratricopeptide repeat protein [Candidatus Sulfotelmatobacter sp.]|nr:tetratricopeptide repeat protein [Candidatus Sulfotelmatobacter sp.]
MRLRVAATVFSLAGALLLGAPARGADTPAAPALVTPASEPADPLAHAQLLFRERKYKESVDELTEYLGAHPRDARALVMRGDAKAELNDDDAALQDYNAAIGIDPEYEYAYVTRCETRLDVDDAAGALADCSRAIQLDPRDGLAYKDRAEVEFSSGAYDAALTDDNQAVTLGEGGAWLFAARCDVERLVGKPEQAAADCVHALALDPKNRRGLWASGRLALSQGRYRDGIQALNAYIEQDPTGSTSGYYYRALAYNRVQSYRLALEDAQTYVQRAPDDPDGYRERAIARYGSGDKDGALADLDAALHGYRKGGDGAEIEQVTALRKAVQAGAPLAP